MTGSAAGELGITGRALQGEERRDATRRALLRAAQQLFVGRGYRTTAVSDIVRAAGVSQGTFYLYFPSKLAIMLALIDLGSKRLLETAQRCVAEQPDPVSALSGFIRELAQFFRANRALLVVLSREVEHVEVSEARQKHNSALCRAIVPAVAHGCASGVFRGADPDLLALMLLESALALFYRLLLAPDAEIPAGIEDSIDAFCLGGIVAR